MTLGRSLKIVIMCLVAIYVSRVGADESRSETVASLIKKDVPVHIDSDRLEYRSQDSSARFWGNVTVRHGNITMHSDELVAFYTEKGGLRQIVASNRVRIDIKKELERKLVPFIKARCERAVFDAQLRTLLLTGQPHLNNKSNTITGEQITVDLDNNSIAVTHAQGKFNVPE